MYIPPKFKEDRIEVLHSAMKDIGVAAIISHGSDGLVASHVPVELDLTKGQFGTILCHFARPNPHVQAIEESSEVLAIFQGPQGYVTPSWYPSKYETGKTVPTLNYVAIHAYGNASTFDAPDKLLAHLKSLTNHFENQYEEPWEVDDAPRDYIEKQSKGIIGIEIQITRLDGKWKMSQNRRTPDRRGVIDGLRAQGGVTDLIIADLVEDALVGDETDMA